MAKRQIGKEQKTEERPDEGVPQPPPFQRNIQIAPLQLIGMPLLALLPILALFGVFGESNTSASAANSDVSLSVDYASRYRYGMQETMAVAVTNLASQSPVTITVAFDRAYLQNFSQLSFLPDASQSTDETYVVDLTNMEEGETRLVTLEMKGDQYWTHDGTVSASISGHEPVSVAVRTTIFP